jgi:hypothetical protein
MALTQLSQAVPEHLVEGTLAGGIVVDDALRLITGHLQTSTPAPWWTTLPRHVFVHYLT